MSEQATYVSIHDQRVKLVAQALIDNSKLAKRQLPIWPSMRFTLWTTSRRRCVRAHSSAQTRRPPRCAGAASEDLGSGYQACTGNAM